MMDKLLFALFIIYLSIYVAGILKLWALNKLTAFRAFLVLFTPVFYVVFIIHFYRIAQIRYHLKKIFLAKMILVIYFIKLGIKVLPIIHAGWIDILGSTIPETLIIESFKEILRSRQWVEKTKELSYTISKNFIF